MASDESERETRNKRVSAVEMARDKSDLYSNSQRRGEQRRAEGKRDEEQASVCRTIRVEVELSGY